jgi:hypothetical protein
MPIRLHSRMHVASYAGPLFAAIAQSSARARTQVNGLYDDFLLSIAQAQDRLYVWALSAPAVSMTSCTASDDHTLASRCCR